MTLASPWRGVCAEATYLQAESFGESAGFLALLRGSHSKAAGHATTSGFAFPPYDVGLGRTLSEVVESERKLNAPKSDASRIRPRVAGGYAPSVAVCNPQ